MEHRRLKTMPNPADPGNGATTVPFHAGRPCRAVPEQHRSAGFVCFYLRVAELSKHT